MHMWEDTYRYLEAPHTVGPPYGLLSLVTAAYNSIFHGDVNCSCSWPRVQPARQQTCTLCTLSKGPVRSHPARVRTAAKTYLWVHKMLPGCRNVGLQLWRLQRPVHAARRHSLHGGLRLAATAPAALTALAAKAAAGLGRQQREVPQDPALLQLAVMAGLHRSGGALPV